LHRAGGKWGPLPRRRYLRDFAVTGTLGIAPAIVPISGAPVRTQVGTA
jgi:hypothetical protein